MPNTTRDVAELTITKVYTDEQMDALVAEVDAGDHDDLDSAIDYVIKRGLAEIKRTRESQEKSKAERSVIKALRAMAQANPQAVLAQTDDVSKLVAQLAKLKK